MANFIVKNGETRQFPVPVSLTPGPETIRQLLRGYESPETILPNAVLFTDANSKISAMTIVGNLSLSGSDAADTAINTLGKSNTIDCGTYE